MGGVTHPSEGPAGVVPAHGDPFLNTLLDGRYRLDALLGRGGMGTVYEAVDTRLDRPVAVKVLRAAEGTDEARFATEVRALARFSHPNLVRLLDAGEVEHSGGYLVMELIEGETLARRLSRGPLPGRATARIAAGLAAALAYVHGRGIVHRDIKPANVLLDGEGVAHLADFGIARLLDTTGMTATGLTLGTPAYLAPEQVQGAEIGPEADVYALGLVLLECLTGRRAFEGTASEITAARLQRAPVIPATLGPAWREAIAGMTARYPADRPPAAVLEGVLRAPLLAESPTAGALGGGERTVLAAPPGAGDTARVESASTAPLPVETSPTERPGAGGGGARRAVGYGALGAVALLGLLGGLLAGGIFSSAPTRRAAPPTTTTAPPTTTTAPPTTTTAPTTTTLPAPTVAGAAGALTAALEAGVASGSVTPAAGQQLANELQPLLFATQSSASPQQVAQFDQLVASFDADVANGLVTGSAIGGISSSVSALASALGTSVPSPTATAPGPPGRFGHGNGNGNGGD